MDLEDLSCSLCQELFDSGDRCPRMLPCGHTYCQRCVAGLFSKPPVHCPEDMTPLAASAASDLPKNFSLLRVITKKQEVRTRAEDSGRCAEHRKKLEYVCLDDRIKVCANCALFGRHRGHNVKPEEDIMREITIRAECLFDLLQLIEKSRATVLDEQVKGSMEDLLERYRHRKQELETTLQQSFQAARARLNDMERSSQMTLQKNFDYIEDNFVNIRDMPKLIDSQASAWIQSAKDRLDRINLGSEDPSYVALDVLDSSSNELFQAGEKVLMELEGLKDLPIAQLEELIQGVTVEYSEALLNGLIRVKSAPKQPQLAQMSELRTALNPEVSKVEHPGEESLGKTSPTHRGKSLVNEGKFEEALDALRLHTMEVADFTGAGGEF